MNGKLECISQSLIMYFVRLLLVCFITILQSACSSSAESKNANTDELSDMVIAQALYLDERTPVGFYQEDIQNDAFYSISHVKNIDLLALADRDGIPVHELASDDFVEALTWSDQAAGYQPFYGQLVANSERLLYHQFTRVDPASPQFINLVRVFKASALNRSGVDRSDSGASYQGKITLSNMVVEDVKLIIEYLWMFTDSNNYKNAVLVSDTTETADAFVHLMKQARLNLSYSESCDTINVYDIHYTIPKDSGLIWKDQVISRVILAKRTGNRIEICK